MTSAFVITSGGAGCPAIERDLTQVGIDVVGRGGAATLVQNVIEYGADLVVCYETHPDDALFAGTAALRTIAPRPVVVFTSDADAEKIERATSSGIDAYVINGYGPERLRPVIHLAQARFKYDRLLREELSEVRDRFNERKLLDRAKGILMRLRGLSEEDAYATLRTTAMHTKQRIGQVAQHVIDAARYAEAVNRAGQLRMLSQRLVKLYALMCAEVTPEVTTGLCRASIERVEANLATLKRTLSRATFGDLIEAVQKPWTPLKAALAARPDPARLNEIDELAERLLAQAETLTRALENAGLAGTLHVINVSGRQRMLSQRLAKLALMASFAAADALGARRREAEAAFAEGLAYLRKIPLTSEEISVLLRAAEADWTAFSAALEGGVAARAGIARLSETLLTTFDELTGHYERGMQMLMS